MICKNRKNNKTLRVEFFERATKLKNLARLKKEMTQIKSEMKEET